MIQGSPEWHAARLGKVTASRVADVTARTKSGWGASRERYMVELLLERRNGVPAPTYLNDSMRWGTDNEPQARIEYEFKTSQPVTQIGFVDHPTIPMAGASPDGLIGDTGLIEIKCPDSHTHYRTWHSGEVDEKYVTQMMWQMACTGREWCDFVSYDPRWTRDEAIQLFIKRVERDDKKIKQLEKEVAAFLGELDARIAVIETRQDLETTLKESA